MEPQENRGHQQRIGYSRTVFQERLGGAPAAAYATKTTGNEQNQRWEPAKVGRNLLKAGNKAWWDYSPIARGISPFHWNGDPQFDGVIEHDDDDGQTAQRRKIACSR